MSEEHHAPEYDTTAGMSVSSVMADHKTTFLKDTGRLEYLERYIPYWRKARQYRAYALMLGLVGAVMLFRTPILSVPAFAAAGYFYVVAEQNHWYSQGAYADHRTNIVTE